MKYILGCCHLTRKASGRDEYKSLRCEVIKVRQLMMVITLLQLGGRAKPVTNQTSGMSE